MSELHILKCKKCGYMGEALFEDMCYGCWKRQQKLEREYNKK